MLEVLSAQMENAQSNLKETETALYVVKYQLAKAQHLSEKKRADLSAQAAKLEKQKEQAQNKVITLKNKMFAAEQKINKAKFDKEQAERKIA